MTSLQLLSFLSYNGPEVGVNYRFASSAWRDAIGTLQSVIPIALSAIAMLNHGLTAKLHHG
jgi:hypothetical protein